MDEHSGISSGGLDDPRDNFISRGKRQQVTRACQACARGKRKCSGTFPCERCIRLKTPETCVEVVPKRFGGDDVPAPSEGRSSGGAYGKRRAQRQSRSEWAASHDADTDDDDYDGASVAASEASSTRALAFVLRKTHMGGEGGGGADGKKKLRRLLPDGDGASIYAGDGGSGASPDAHSHPQPPTAKPAFSQAAGEAFEAGVGGIDLLLRASGETPTGDAAAAIASASSGSGGAGRGTAGTGGVTQQKRMLQQQHAQQQVHAQAQQHAQFIQQSYAFAQQQQQQQRYPAAPTMLQSGLSDAYGRGRGSTGGGSGRGSTSGRGSDFDGSSDALDGGTCGALMPHRGPPPQFSYGGSSGYGGGYGLPPASLQMQLQMQQMQAASRSGGFLPPPLLQYGPAASAALSQLPAVGAPPPSLSPLPPPPPVPGHHLAGTADLSKLEPYPAWRLTFADAFTGSEAAVAAATAAPPQQRGEWLPGTPARVGERRLVPGAAFKYEANETGLAMFNLGGRDLMALGCASAAAAALAGIGAGVGSGLGSMGGARPQEQGGNGLAGLGIPGVASSSLDSAVGLGGGGGASLEVVWAHPADLLHRAAWAHRMRTEGRNHYQWKGRYLRKAAALPEPSAGAAAAASQRAVSPTSGGGGGFRSGHGSLQQQLAALQAALAARQPRVRFDEFAATEHVYLDFWPSGALRHMLSTFIDIAVVPRSLSPEQLRAAQAAELAAQQQALLQQQHAYLQSQAQALGFSLGGPGGGAGSGGSGCGGVRGPLLPQQQMLHPHQALGAAVPPGYAASGPAAVSARSLVVPGSVAGGSIVGGGGLVSSGSAIDLSAAGFGGAARAPHQLLHSQPVGYVPPPVFHAAAAAAAAGAYRAAPQESLPPPPRLRHSSAADQQQAFEQQQQISFEQLPARIGVQPPPVRGGGGAGIGGGGGGGRGSTQGGGTSSTATGAAAFAYRSSICGDSSSDIRAMDTRGEEGESRRRHGGSMAMRGETPPVPSSESASEGSVQLQQQQHRGSSADFDVAGAPGLLLYTAQQQQQHAAGPTAGSAAAASASLLPEFWRMGVSSSINSMVSTGVGASSGGRVPSDAGMGGAGLLLAGLGGGDGSSRASSLSADSSGVGGPSLMQLAFGGSGGPPSGPYPAAGELGLPYSLSGGSMHFNVRSGVTSPETLFPAGGNGRQGSVSAMQPSEGDVIPPRQQRNDSSSSLGMVL